MKEPKKLTLSQKILQDAAVYEDIVKLLTPIPKDAAQPWYADEDPIQYSLEIITESHTIEPKHNMVSIVLLAADENKLTGGLWISRDLLTDFVVIGGKGQYQMKVPELRTLLLDNDCPRYEIDIHNHRGIYTVVSLDELISEGVVKRIK